MKVEKMPEGALIAIKLCGFYYLTPRETGSEAFRSFDLTETKYAKSLPIPHIHDIIGRNYGPPTHDGTNKVIEGLEDVLEIGLCEGGSISVRIKPDQIRSYERIGFLKDFEIVFKHTEK